MHRIAVLFCYEDKQRKDITPPREHKGDRQAVQRRRLRSLGVSVLSFGHIESGGCLIAQRHGALVYTSTRRSAESNRIYSFSASAAAF